MRKRQRDRGLAGVAVGVGLLTMTLLLSIPAQAHHTSVTTGTYSVFPSPWNGYKVYLSSPRHSNSGSRGECGWEENINGRHWNVNAALKQSYNSNGDRFFDRKYRAQVSPNSRDDGFLANRTASNNWGAHVHLPTHTNAPGGGAGCPHSASYLLVMFRSGNSNSVALKDELITRLNPVTPGGNNSWNCDGLAECNANAPHRAYVELFFHTNSSAVNWYQAGGGHGSGVTYAWRYGWAIDVRLGYPR